MGTYRAMANPSRQDTERLPSTLRRSDPKAQRTYLETKKSAEQTYDGNGRAASRVAYGSLKHTHEKVGDHWEPKSASGPSDSQSKRHGAAKRDDPRPTAQGTDANASKSHLMDVAKRLDISGRTKMSKQQLVDAIERENRKATARAR